MAIINVTVEFPEWDDAETGYESLETAIVQQASNHLYDKLKNELLRDIRFELTTRIQNDVAEMLINLRKFPVQKTNGHGSPVGEPAMLPDLVVSEAVSWLEKRVGRNGYEKQYNSDTTQTRVEFLIRKIVQEEIGGALKQFLIEKIEAANDVISETIDTMVKEAIRTKLNL